MRDESKFSNGFNDGFPPLEQIDLEKVSSFSDLLEQMSKTAFGGRALGKAADVMCKMFSDPDCLVVATISGAMTIAKQGKIIAQLIEKGLINIVVTTGAVICHGLIEELGNKHFELTHGWNDVELYNAGYNRIYDTLELERSMDDAELTICKILSERSSDKPLSSCELCSLLGAELTKSNLTGGLIQTAYEKNAPIFIPAFCDSELGLDLAIHNKLAPKEKKITFDPLIDLDLYTEQVTKPKCLGIFTIGGGVPRNWAQQVGPYVDILQRRGMCPEGEHARFDYGVRICPEPVHWGGLSGCTYSEGVSWGKFVPSKDHGRFAEVLCDATIALPILAKAVLERLQ